MSEKNLGGRPTKFTPARTKSIIESIGKGVPYIIAAEANGIGESTLYEWLLEGRNDIELGIKSEKAQFAESIKKAEEKKISFHLDSIASKPERWQAEAWLLERRWWKHFSPNASVIDFNERIAKLENGDKGNVEVDGKETK